MMETNSILKEKVKIETFTSQPPCAGCVKLLELADEIAEQYKGKLEVVKHIGSCEEFKTYKLTLTPAVVINNGRIKIMGVCPSKQTLETALGEMGV